VRYWDCATGLSDVAGKAIDANMRDPNAMIERISNDTTRCVYILRDLHAWMDPIVKRGLKSLARALQGAESSQARSIVILTPSAEVPPELSGATVVDYPLPDREEMASILDDVLSRVSKDSRANVLDASTRDAAIDAVVGLTAEEAAACYAKSLVTSKRIDPQQVSGEKKRVIARDRVLTWYDPDPRGFDGIGGLDVLKPWAMARKLAFSAEARAYGLPAPKGVLCVGVAGCGKSLFAKTLASAWGQVLLRLDMGALKSKYVGESEANIRKALALAETVAPCILWIDEIEKALAGSTGEQGDGGVSTDALGALLTWMQERTASVFVVATSNDVRNLPPELLRKGRFDEIFWVDLPTTRERTDIVRVAMKAHGQNPSTVDVDAIAQATVGFTGAEVTAIVPDSMFAAFADGARKITTADLKNAAETVVPLSKTSAEKLQALRDWAKGRARNASTPDVQAKGTGPMLDLE
jgi:hypothetical protein